MLQDKLVFLPHEDVVLPTQYWDTVRRQDRLEPERKLMLAVLENAILTYLKHLGRRNLYFYEVDQWLRDRKSARLYSFENICDFLGLSAERIRHALLKLAVNKAAGLQSAPQLKRVKRRRTLRAHIWSHALKERPGARVRVA